MHRILLVGINYDPEQTGIGPYTTGLADHLARRGHEVTVITGMPHYPQWKIYPTYRRKLRLIENRREVAVHRMWQYTPSQQSAFGRGLYELSFFLQAMSARPLRPPDCVVGIVPSLSGGAAAALLARRFHIPFGLIFQDLMGHAASQSGIPGGSLAAHPAHMIEGWAARRATRVAIVASAFRSHLIDIGVDDARIVHLPNWSHVGPPKRPPHEVRRSLGWDENRSVILHAGNMGYKQDLDNVVGAARLADERDLDLLFVFMGDGSDRRRLETLSGDLRNVRFLDSQPRESFMDVLAAADVLLLNERNTVFDMSLPSKITSYFCAGRPVVAAVPNGGATSVELTKSGGALVVQSGDAAILLRAIELVNTNPNLSSGLVARGLAYASQNLQPAPLLERANEFIDCITTESFRRSL